jgi:hypothetical protein
MYEHFVAAAVQSHRPVAPNEESRARLDRALRALAEPEE